MPNEKKSGKLKNTTRSGASEAALPKRRSRSGGSEAALPKRCFRSGAPEAVLPKRRSRSGAPEAALPKWRFEAAFRKRRFRSGNPGAAVPKRRSRNGAPEAALPKRRSRSGTPEAAIPKRRSRSGTPEAALPDPSFVTRWQLNATAGPQSAPPLIEKDANQKWIGFSPVSARVSKLSMRRTYARAHAQLSIRTCAYVCIFADIQLFGQWLQRERCSLGHGDFNPSIWNLLWMALT